MNKTDNFNDTPIENPNDDRFGIDHFAQALSKSIKSIRSPIGSTIALNGTWGSGKSSAVNLIRYHLKSEIEDESLEIIDFKCWWFRGEEALTLAFLQELNLSLSRDLNDTAKELLPKIGKTLLQTGNIVEPVVNIVSGGLFGGLAKGAIDFTKRFFPEGENIEKIFLQLSKALEEQDKRYLVLIDDIDRLTPEEALLIFRLIKSVGRLPNVMYLLVFDRELAEKAVKEKYPSEGSHFLDKIIQASFEIPLPQRDDLNNAVLSQIQEICGGPDDDNQLRRFMNVFYDAISPYISTPRDIMRLTNAMSVSWPAIAKEVNTADYVALEALRLFEPSIYNAIRLNKNQLCGNKTQNDQNTEITIEMILDQTPEKNKIIATTALKRLFPRLGNTFYSGTSEFEKQRLVCAENHFDTYFSLSIGERTLSTKEINEIINKTNDKEFIKRTLIRASETIGKNGKSKVPLILDELNIHADRVKKENFQTLLSAIFEVADDINRVGDEEKGFLKIANNKYRIHWLIRRLTLERCSLEERSILFANAYKEAQLGWLVDFSSSAIGDHFPINDEVPTSLDECLMLKDSIDELKNHVIKKIEFYAVEEKLINQPNLSYILYRWRDLLNDDNESVKNWCNEQLENDTSVSLFANAFTGESWTHSGGFNGMGDRVSMKKINISLSGLTDLIDIKKFRSRLEDIEISSDLDEEHIKYVNVILQAWRKEDKQNSDK